MKTPKLAAFFTPSYSSSSLSAAASSSRALATGPPGGARQFSTGGRRSRKPVEGSLPKGRVTQTGVAVDSFFALHRPLLELPLPRDARRTAAALPRPVHVSRDAFATLSSAEQKNGIVTVDKGQGEPEYGTAAAAAGAAEELVDAVDVGEDGVPSSAAYKVTKAAAMGVVEDSAMHDEEQYYDEWLLGQHLTEEEYRLQKAEVLRYLAQRTPFSPPLPRVSRRTKGKGKRAKRSTPSASSASVGTKDSLSAEEREALDFLQPFSRATSRRRTTPVHFDDGPPESVPPSVSQHMLHRFLADAEQTYAAAQTPVQNSLDRALRSYTSTGSAAGGRQEANELEGNDGKGGPVVQIYSKATNEWETVRKGTIYSRIREAIEGHFFGAGKAADASHNATPEEAHKAILTAANKAKKALEQSFPGASVFVMDGGQLVSAPAVQPAADGVERKARFAYAGRSVRGGATKMDLTRRVVARSRAKRRARMPHTKKK